MTEKSYWWTTGSTGDGASTYTRVDLQHVVAVLGCASAFEGVVPSYLNECAGSVGGANQYDIDTGGAIVDGKPYRTDATVNVTIPSAVGAGNERIDRIVLRADWTAQTVRITRIAGTDAAEPTPPAITQSSGTTYDIKLYQVRVNESGTVTTELDERVWAITPTDNSTLEHNGTGDLRIKDLGVTTAKIAADAVTSAKVPNNAIGNSEIRDSGGCSVIGRSANSSGDPADIVAADDNLVLARESGAVGFTTVKSGMIQDGAVTAPKIAADSIDSSQIDQGIPILEHRQGGSATAWATAGAANYYTGGQKIKIQVGTASWVGSASSSGDKTITFPEAFDYTPIVLLTPFEYSNIPTLAAYTITASGFTMYWESDGSKTTFPFMWVAIGPGE